MDTYSVYALVDQCRVPFYVGQTNNLRRRLKRHLGEAQNGNTLYLYNKIRQILRNGGSIDIVAIDSGLTEMDADKREIERIAEFRQKGRICNILDGGRPKMTAEMQKQAAEKRRGQRKSEQTKQRISEARLGMKFSQSHKDALKKAWKRTPEQLKEQAAKSSATSKGKINTKRYLCVSPEGKEYTTEQGLTAFCEQFGLTRANMVHVSQGRRSNHKGWTAKRIDDARQDYPLDSR